MSIKFDEGTIDNQVCLIKNRPISKRLRKNMTQKIIDYNIHLQNKPILVKNLYSDYETIFNEIRDLPVV